MALTSDAGRHEWYVYCFWGAEADGTWPRSRGTEDIEQTGEEAVESGNFTCPEIVDSHMLCPSFRPRVAGLKAEFVGHVHSPGCLKS